MSTETPSPKTETTSTFRNEGKPEDKKATKKNGNVIGLGEKIAVGFGGMTFSREFDSQGDGDALF